MSAPPPTKNRIVITAANLFRQKGYHGVGLSEILSKSGAPKGSLYHHFPSGKADLARAAADWASAGMLQVIDDAFTPAQTYADGVTTLSHKLAKFFDISDHRDGCPVSAILFQDLENGTFRAQSERIFDSWISRVAEHATRLGEPTETVLDKAEALLITIQGAWVLARARRSSDVIRQTPRRLGL